MSYSISATTATGGSENIWYCIRVLRAGYNKLAMRHSLEMLRWHVNYNAIEANRFTAQGALRYFERRMA